MNRKSFIGKLFGALLAPFAVKAENPFTVGEDLLDVEILRPEPTGVIRSVKPPPDFHEWKVDVLEPPKSRFGPGRIIPYGSKIEREAIQRRIEEVYSV